jgi:hypothetical protein
MNTRDLNRRDFIHSGLAVLLGGPALGAARAQTAPLDLNVSDLDSSPYAHLDVIAERHPAASTYIPLVAASAERHRSAFYVDPVLFLGLIKQESAFGQHLISPVGAGGPVQFMPSTAQDLGLRVYLPDPDYFSQARKLYGQAGRDMHQAIQLFKDGQWRRAMIRMKRGRKAKAKGKKLFDRYREELEQLTQDKTDQELRGIDERFVDWIAVDKGVLHLAGLLKHRKGDVREALSAYNAGLGRVKQFDGIPYIEETVIFQNRIVNFYKYWAPRAR